MDIKSVLSRLSLSDPTKVARKAMELSRRCDVRCQSGYSTLFLRGAATCQGALCVDLACKLCGETNHGFKTKDFAKIGGVPVNVYERTMQSVVHVLGVEFPVSLEELSIRFGAARVRSFAERVLDLYRKRIQAQRRERGELSVVIETTSPLHAAAALYVCAKSLEFTMSLDDLITAIPGVSKDGVNALCTSLIEICGDVLRDGSGFRKEAKKRRGRKKKEDSSKVGQKTSGIGCSMISLHPPTTLSSREKQNVIDCENASDRNETFVVVDDDDDDDVQSARDPDSMHDRRRKRRKLARICEEEVDQTLVSDEFVGKKEDLDDDDDDDGDDDDDDGIDYCDEDDEDDEKEEDEDDGYEEWKQHILKSTEEKEKSVEKKTFTLKKKSSTLRQSTLKFS
eukprot:TRINITY_DN1524_c0_g1_i1.p1 TRINITY_DN1524_c0_g1~~TRINITY_DN1524_c0_g1_i1.p1  ORF type:complete len:403 (+),score=131.86 TRINITY_DN1524_c0_g1_i1:22-1209(+)